MNGMESKSGYELAAGILQEHPDNPIEAMLEANGGEESEWLEFKASMTLLPEHEANGETTDDLHLNFVKSIVALVNTYGGAFVIGVDDKKHEPVPILLGDMTEETYIRRQVCGKLLKQEWKKLKGKHAGETWKLNHGITHFVTPRFYTFKGERVIVLLIQPCEKGDEVIVKISTDKLDAFNLFYRARGGQGGVAKYSAPEEIESYKNARVHNLLLRGGEPKGNGCSTVETPRSSHFAGRSEELERLRRQLESGKIPVVSGAGGGGGGPSRNSCGNMLSGTGTSIPAGCSKSTWSVPEVGMRHGAFLWRGPPTPE